MLIERAPRHVTQVGKVKGELFLFFGMQVADVWRPLRGVEACEASLDKAGEVSLLRAFSSGECEGWGFPTTISLTDECWKFCCDRFACARAKAVRIGEPGLGRVREQQQ
jgi:hypothetical protein